MPYFSVAYTFVMCAITFYLLTYSLTHLDAYCTRHSIETRADDITDNVDGKHATDRSQLVANQARVVAVVGQVRFRQSQRVPGVVPLNLQRH